jgi:predicted transcriptional regulator
MADVEVQPISDFDLNDEEEARLDAEAEADYAAGRVTSHERMCEWLTKLANGERVPHPEA